MYVNMSNALVRAAQGLDIHQKRLLMFALGKLDSKTKLKNTQVKTSEITVRINVADMMEKYSLDGKNAYSDTKKACDKLMKQSIRFFHKDTDGKRLETKMQWVGSATYKATGGWVEIEFYHKLFPMIFQLEEVFTSYKLERAAALRSVYSWRLFELLMQFKKTGFLSIKIDEFADAMEATKSMRYNFANMRQRIIEPAVAEIKKRDGLNLVWEPVKHGRKVTGLEFRFPVEQQKAIKFPKGTHKKVDAKKSKGVEFDGMSENQIRGEYDGLLRLVKADPEQTTTVGMLASKQQKERFKALGLDI